MRKMAKIGVAASAAGSVFASFALAATAFAQSNITLYDPLHGQNFNTVVQNVAYFMYAYIAIPLVAIMVLVGAFQMMTAAGDAEKVSKARKTLQYAAIGFLFVLLAGGAASLIQQILGVQSS